MPNFTALSRDRQCRSTSWVLLALLLCSCAASAETRIALIIGIATTAAAAFSDLVDYGLRTNRLAVKILFRPGSVRFASEAAFSAFHDSWLQQIATRAVSSKTCLQVVGHTSPSGPAMNDSLSLPRAEDVRSRLQGDQPALQKRIVASGLGSRENLIGTGRDDASDMLDRRVEFKPIEPCT